MGISSEDITKATANESWRTVRRLEPLVAAMRKALLDAGIIIECPTCGGKGYPGVACLTDCKACNGGGITSPRPPTPKR